jgi:DnaK suppressor protein
MRVACRRIERAAEGCDSRSARVQFPGYTGRETQRMLGSKPEAQTMTRTTRSENVDAGQIDSLRAAMLARARQLREEIRQALLRNDSEHYVQVADAVRDLEDESFADLVVDVGLAEIDRDLDELRAIDAALLRVNDGSYGLCEVCDRPIEQRRLQVAPEARRCIDCQTLFERTHFQKTGRTL